MSNGFSKRWQDRRVDVAACCPYCGHDHADGIDNMRKTRCVKENATGTLTCASCSRPFSAKLVRVITVWATDPAETLTPPPQDGYTS